jgi:hypothetical protein
MPINSRAKGARTERLLAEELRRILKWECRRSQQFCGAAGDADLIVEGLPVFVESKAVERLNVVEALEKAVEQAGESLPLLLHKKNRTPWLLTVRLSDLPSLSKMIASRLPNDGT